MNVQLAHIDTILARIERLADGLRLDPDRDVRRSAGELREAFTARRAIEPAVARMRDSVEVLRRSSQDGPDYLDAVVEHELLPHLRRLGFDV